MHAAEGKKVTTCKHCHIKSDAIVIAALCDKVQALNARHEESVSAAGTHVEHIHAVDRSYGVGRNITDEAKRRAIDKQTRGQMRRLGIYAGMPALLTRNQNVETDNVNGAPGTVVDVERKHDGSVHCILFRPNSAPDNADPLCTLRTSERVW